MKQYRLLKKWRDFSEGDIVELEEETAKALMLAETIEEYDEKAEAAKAADAEAQEATIKSAVQDAVSEALKNVDSSKDGVRVRFEVSHEEADDGFKNLGDQLKAIKEFAATGKIDKRQEGAARKAASGANELIDANGGFLVDPDIMSELSTRMMETGILVSRTNTIEVSGDGLVWKERKDYDRTDRSVDVYWTEEAGEITSSKAAYAQREMRLRKLAGLYYSTAELDQDAPALAGMVESWFITEFGFALDSAVMNGTGAGQPLGYRNSSAIVEVAKESGQTADTITDGNVSAMFARMPANLIGGAVWLINNDAWNQLPQMTTGDQPVFLAPSMSIQEAPGGMLLGRPVLICEHCETLGDAGDIQFVNLGEYILARKGMIQSAVSSHVRFIYDENAYKWTLRCNGQPKWSNKMTPVNGTAYISPFVQLAERA